MTLTDAPPPTQAPRRLTSRSVLARDRLPLARQLLERCDLCLHHCETNRLAGPSGLCHAGPDARFFAAQTDVSDELELIPSFAISLSGCTLRCDFCVTGGPSWNPRAGLPTETASLSQRARQALQQGARSVMILGGEPTLHPVTLLQLLAALPDDARLALKTNACFTPHVRTLLAQLVDVWIPDLKFGNPDCAARLAGIPKQADDWGVVTSNLLWMARTETTSDLIVRHLYLPGHLECCWTPIADWLAVHLPEVKVSLRAGYWPAWQAHRHPELRRPVPHSEWNQALAVANDRRLRLVP